MGLLDLNDDVLTAIVAHLDSASARQLSYTAHDIHLIATYRALRSVTLRSCASIIAFVKYMLENMRHRVPALQKLEILCDIRPSELHLPRLDPSGELKELCSRAAALLTDLFQGSIGLQVLVMVSAEIWMQYDPRMVKALCSLRALRDVELGLFGDSEHTSKLISNLSSAPHRLALHGGASHEALVPTSHVCLRSVTMLMADNPSNLPPPKALARAFPNVVALDLTRAVDFGPWRRTDRAPVAVSWPSLERLRGSVSSFEGWTAVSPVHSLEFTDQLSCNDSALVHRGAPPVAVGARKTTRACSAANIAIANFQPAVLVVELNISIALEDLKRLIKNSTRLRYLAILMDDTYRQAGIGSWWYRICEALVGSSVVCLELRVLCGSTGSVGQSTTKLTDLLHYETLVNAYKNAFTSVLEFSATRTPGTLRYLSLDCSPAEKPTWRHDFLALEDDCDSRTPIDLRWWSLQGEGNTRVAEMLDVDDGERISAYVRSIHYNESKLDQGIL